MICESCGRELGCSGELSEEMEAFLVENNAVVLHQDCLNEGFVSVDDVDGLREACVPPERI